MMYLGCDPGLSGALALWRPSVDILEIHDMPTLKLKPGSNKRTLDAVELARVIDKAISGLKTFAVIEQAGARPGEGLASAHANGRNWGVAYGILCAQFIQVETVAPAKWKRSMNCPASKDGARGRAKQMLPKYADLFARVKDDGRAEAALLALYAELLFRQQTVTP